MTADQRKWRPSLAMVTLGMFGAVLGLGLVGFAASRLAIRLPAALEIGVALLVGGAGAALVGTVFVRAISRPLEELARRADAVARGDRPTVDPLTRHGTRELASVAESFIGMARSLRARSDYIRTFARHVSHELKSPLTAIRGAAELIRDSERMTAEERARFLDNVIRDVDRLTLLLDRLHEQARADNPDLGGRTSLAAAAPRLRERFPDLVLEFGGDADLALGMSTDNLSIVLGHLLDNALRHGAKQVEVAAERRGSQAAIVVQDDGGGISPGNREQVFEPFFTTRRERGGAGMGLAIVRAILTAHGGGAALEDCERGARFVLTAPLRPSHRKPER